MATNSASTVVFKINIIVHTDAFSHPSVCWVLIGGSALYLPIKMVVWDLHCSIDCIDHASINLTPITAWLLIILKFGFSHLDSTDDVFLPLVRHA